MGAPRFKTNDDDFSSQATDLIQYLRDNKTRLGLTDPQIDAVADGVTPFTTKLPLYEAAERTARGLSLEVQMAKPVALKSLGTAVDNLGDKWTNEDRLANGMPTLEGRGGKRPIPAESPILLTKSPGGGLVTVDVRDSAHVAKNGKPADTDGVHLRYIFEAAGVSDDYDDWRDGGSHSDLRSVVPLDLKLANRGKTVKIVGRYYNTSGYGPWGQIAEAVVA